MRVVNLATRTLALAPALVLLGLCPSQAVSRSTSMLGGVEAASRAFDDAQYRGDVAALERFLSPGFLYVRGSGRVAGIREFVANFNDPAQHLEPFVITDRRLIALGCDAVIVTADGIIRGTAAGKPFAEHFRYADTFVRRGGRWQVVYVQVTPVAS